MIITFFFFNDTATTEIYTLSLHDALPISAARIAIDAKGAAMAKTVPAQIDWLLHEEDGEHRVEVGERIEIADDYWRGLTERLDLASGMRVFLTSADVHRPLTLEPRHEESEPWLVSNIAVR